MTSAMETSNQKEKGSEDNRKVLGMLENITDFVTVLKGAREYKLLQYENNGQEKKKKTY